ncbi:UNVERIFIED_CONTAM: hypothetical protein GTU68_028338 [Idotea baltica]|nr:hypothetical protein [Idotea baltica]
MAKWTIAGTAQDDCSSDFLRIDRCCDLARLGGTAVQTNPQVGAVIIHHENTKIIAENLHQFFGGPHAEVNTIQSSDKQSVKNSTIYVSLEPCSHAGKTPPCVDLIIGHGFHRCVVGHRDPNPLVNGKGIELLRQAGIQVTEISSVKAKGILRRFIVNQRLERPYIVLKWARSADGFMGRKGERVQISNAMSQRLVHKWRSELQSIMVGTETALNDNPQLNNRLYHGPSPLRIIMDRKGRLPPKHQLLNGKIPTLIFTYGKRDIRDNLEFVQIAEGDSELDQVFKVLYERNVGSVMIEGGEKLLSSCLKSGLWDECRVITSDSLLEQGIPSPTLPMANWHQEYVIGGDTVRTLLRPL